MLAKCGADRLRLRAKCNVEKDAQHSVIKQLQSERRMQRDFERRLNPRTKDDFALLFTDMEGQQLFLSAFLSITYLT